MQSEPEDGGTGPDDARSDGTEDAAVDLDRATVPKGPSEPTGTPGPYRSNDEHLRDELQRIDQLARAATVRWRHTIAATKPEHLWGMLQVSEAEIDAYLGSHFRSHWELSRETKDAVETFWKNARERGEAIRERVSKTPAEIQLRLQHLQTALSLSRFECDVLLVCLLSELDGRYRRLFGYLQDDISRNRPSVELVLRILEPVSQKPGQERAAFNDIVPLMRHRLVTVSRDTGPDDPLSMRLVGIDDRIAGYLLGSDVPDGRLHEMISGPVEPVEWDELGADEQRTEQLRGIAELWNRRKQSSEMPAILYFHGPYGSGRLKAACAICAATHTPLFIVDIERALAGQVPWDLVLRLAHREAALHGAALYWTNTERLREDDEPWPRWHTLMDAVWDYAGLTFLASESPWNPQAGLSDGLFLRVEFRVPDYARRLELWNEALPQREAFARPAPDLPLLAELLANGFQFTEGQIEDAVAAARREAIQRDATRPELTIDDVYEGCRRQSARRLITFARRIEPRTELTFDDLVLPDANKRQLDELRDRIRHRSQVYTGLGYERRLSLGKGLIALFSGSSGTGKTMAAELLAREQGVDLYKVDLSAVVSKYVGETEKNLARVFTEAEDANAILLFDEADALFGKRGEVKEAQDRWANMEINYLLQRIEEYAGVVILTSNLRQNIDEAFLRRIHLIVEFPFPEADARVAILRGMFPEGVERPPTKELEDLANRFKLSGGSFKNIVLDATFRALAADEGKRPQVRLRHLVAGTAREYQKLGKPVTKSDFGETFYAWVEEDIL